MKIAIVYDSGFGHTDKLAKAVAEGARQVGETEVSLIHVGQVTDYPWDELAQADAIIFGSPTYNSGISAKLKAFMEASTRPAWLSQAWRDKPAAGFTNSGTASGDKLAALMSMALFAAQHGMTWVNLGLLPGKTEQDLNRLGSWLGAMAQSDDAPAEITPPAGDLNTAAHLGERVARAAARLR